MKLKVVLEPSDEGGFTVYVFLVVLVREIRKKKPLRILKKPLRILKKP
jgi:hypothetical protein